MKIINLITYSKLMTITTFEIQWENQIVFYSLFKLVCSFEKKIENS